MAAFIAENMAPIMFAALIAMLLLGYPVAFSLAALGLGFFVIGVELAPYSNGAINLSWPLMGSLPDRIFSIVNNDTLLAVPFFTFMGLILQRSGMAEDLLETVGQLFGTVRGGLAYAVIFVGALLAATTGVVAASVISMGLISLPIMLRYGYDRRLASGVIAASGTLAQIIPPSLVLIVIADQLGKSVGDMYAGAFVPGLTLTALYALYVFGVTQFYPNAAPGLPLEAIGFKEPDGSRGFVSLAALAIVSGGLAVFLMRDAPYAGADHVILTMAAAIALAFAATVVNWLYSQATGRRFLSRLAEQTTFVMVPPLLLIFLVLGTIFIGVATPTEGGAMGAVGALALAFTSRLSGADAGRFYGNIVQAFGTFSLASLIEVFADLWRHTDARRFSLSIVKSAAEATAKLSAFVMFILIGARIFSLTFYGVNGHVWVEHLLTSLPGGQLGFLIVVNVLVFVLAFFLDFFELAFIVLPLLAPAASALGIDLVWFGVMLAVNMQTSFMHPPFGFALFYLRSVAPKEPYADAITGRTMAPVTTGQIYWGAIPFVVIQCVMVGLVIAFPGLVMPAARPPASPQEIRIEGPGLVPVPGAETPRGFNLPGSPPAIDGAPPSAYAGPGAPTLDLSKPPEIE